MTVEQEQSLKKKVLRGNWGIAKDRASIHASMEKVQSYEEAFAKIQAATGISDIDELVKQFIENEDQNFKMFNYLNELNVEIEKGEEASRHYVIHPKGRISRVGVIPRVGSQTCIMTRTSA